MGMPLKTLLILSLGGTLLGLSLMLLRRLLGKKLPSAFYYCAWLAVLLRFLVPLPGHTGGCGSAAGLAPHFLFLRRR